MRAVKVDAGVGSALLELSAEDVVRADCKEYEEAGAKFAVAQIEEPGLDEFEGRRDGLQEALGAMAEKRGLDFALLLVTDITRQDSVMLGAGDERLLGRIDFPALGRGAWLLKGVVSRKKQLLPHLLEVLSAR